MSTLHTYTAREDPRIPPTDTLRRITRVLAEAADLSADELWAAFGRALDRTEESPVSQPGTRR